MRRIDRIKKRFMDHSDERDTNKFVDDVHYLLGMLDDYHQIEVKVMFMIKEYSRVSATRKDKKNSVKEVMAAYHDMMFNKNY